VFPYYSFDVSRDCSDILYFFLKNSFIKV
jgi:hypothetical protein